MSVSVPHRPPSPAVPSPNVAVAFGKQPTQSVSPPVLSAAAASSSSSSSPRSVPASPSLPPADAALQDIASHISLLSSLLLSTSTDHRSKLELLLRIIDYSKQCSDWRVDLTSLLSDRASALFRALRLLSVDKDPMLRAQSLRTLRYLLSSPASVSVFYHLNLDLFLIRSLEREQKYLWERLQAFKLYKRLLALQPHRLSRALVQSILSIAEQPKDDFRRVSLDAVREMMLLIPELVCSCNGIRVLLDSILDPACSDIAAKLTLTLLFLLDQPATRQFLRPSLDLVRLLSVFTDTAAPDSPDREARRLAAHRCVVMMMRSWPGILCLTCDRSALSSLVQVLALPVTVKGASWAREAVFDLLLEVVSVVKASDMDAVSAHAAAAASSALTSSSSSSASLTSPYQHDLLHSYLTCILLSFIDCGLVTTLTQLSSSLDGEFRGVATKLLVEILHLAAHLLPSSLCSHLNALPTVMAAASSFTDGEGGRVRALGLITTLSEEGNDGSELSLTLPDALSGRREVFVNDVFSSSSSSSSSLQHGLYLHRYIAQTDFSEPPASRHSGLLSSLRSHHLSPTLEERELDSLIKRTQIPATKDFRSWDTQLILHLLEGPLTSPVNLIAAMSRSKFIKRLCSFLRPEKLMFSALDFTPPHLVFVRIAVALFRCLLACQEGRDYAYFLQLVDGIFELVLSEIGRGRDDKAAAASGDKKRDSNSNSNSLFAPSPQHAHTSNGLPAAAASSGSTSAAAVSASSSSSTSSSSRSRTVSADDSDLPVGGGSMSPRHPPSSSHSRTLSRITRSKHKSSYRCLSRPNLSRKLSQAYFLLIGLLSSSRFGMSFFDKFSLYEHLYQLCNDHSKDYLTRCLILHLDYSERTARTLLETWVKGGSVHLRKFAVSFLRSMLRSRRSDSHWAIGMMVAQLTHSDASLRAAVLSVLEEVAVDGLHLPLLVKKKPQLQACGQLGHVLQALFVGSKAGLEFVQSSGALAPLLKEWREGCVRYVETIERSLVSALSGEDAKDRERESTGGGGGGSNAGVAGMGGGAGGAAGGGSTSGAHRAAVHKEKAEEKRGNSLQVDKGLASTNMQTSALTSTAASASASLLSPTASTNRSSSPTPSSPPPPSPNPHSPSPSRSAPFFFYTPTARTQLDDHFFSRCHELPWTVELTAEWPNGRSILLPVDCFVFSSPYEEKEREEEGLDGETAAAAASLHPLRLYLVANLLDSHGQPSPYRLDANVTLRARLSVGGGQSDRFEHEVISRPASAAAAQLSSGSSRHLASPFRTPSSSPRAGHHSPHLSTSLASLPVMNEHDTHLDDREWMKSFFTFPLPEHACRPSVRAAGRTALDFAPSVAVSAGGGATPATPANRGSLWTTTKDDDRCRWTFTLTPAALPPAPRRERSSTASATAAAAGSGGAAAGEDHYDWLLETLMFPLSMPSQGVNSVCLARHLYGELSQTREGCDLLRHSGQLSDFVRCVLSGEEEWYEAAAAKAGDATRKRAPTATPAASADSALFSPSSPSPSASSSSFSSPSSFSNLQKRAALWALGHVSSSPLGFSLLQQFDPLVPFISFSASHHPVLSFRGSCFYILSLMARSAVGRQALSQLGWAFSADPRVSTVVPADALQSLRPFLQVEHSSFVGAWPADKANVYGIPSKPKSAATVSPATAAAVVGAGAVVAATVSPPPPASSPSASSAVAVVTTALRSYTEAELDILLHISNLCNYVTQKPSLQSLRSMRLSSAFAHLFTSPALLLEAMRMLSCYQFRLPARRFLLFDLFGSVVFTEQNMAAFDCQFLPDGRDGRLDDEADAADQSVATAAGDRLAGSNGADRRPLLLSPPPAARSASLSTGGKRARPTLSTAALPPHPQHRTASAGSSSVASRAVPQPITPSSAAAPTSSTSAAGAAEATAEAAPPAIDARAGLPPHPPERDSSGSVKGKGGASLGRDRSLSVPARSSSDGSYEGRMLLDDDRGQATAGMGGGRSADVSGSSASDASPSPTSIPSPAPQSPDVKG